jgi:hypothetical protein
MSAQRGPRWLAATVGRGAVRLARDVPMPGLPASCGHKRRKAKQRLSPSPRKYVAQRGNGPLPRNSHPRTAGREPAWNMSFPPA